MMGQSSPFNPLTFLFLRAFLQWQVVIGMEAEQIIESLANYIWFLRVANAVCISRQYDLFNSAEFYKTHRLTLHRQLNTVQLRNKRKNVTYNKIGSELGSSK